MTSAELEARYLPQIRRVGSLLLLPADAAVSLVADCAESDVNFLGVEAFRLHDDGGIQPALEFSNIRFGQTEKNGKTIRLTEFRRALRSDWAEDHDVLKHTQELIRNGAANGYTWFEVTIEDQSNESLLFFRSIDA